MRTLLIVLALLLAACGDEPAAEQPAPAVTEEDTEDEERSTQEIIEGIHEREQEEEPVEEEEPEPVVEEEPEPFSKADYEDMTAREFRKLIRNPDSNAGTKVRLWGEVMQYDSRTGDDQMLAHVSGDRDECEYDICDYYSDGELALLAASGTDFDDMLEEDHFAAYGTLFGTHEYETAMSVDASVPVFIIERVKIIE